MLSCVLSVAAISGVRGQEADQKPESGEGRVLLSQAGGPRIPGPEEKERMRLRIGLTKEQQAQMEAIFVESGRQVREILSKMRELNEQLGALYDSYDYDRNQARAIRRELVRLHHRWLLLHAENEEKLRRLMSREQFARFRALMKEEWERCRREREGRREHGRNRT
jgi:Spy/CpxP family protein refolding chaperone